jgi:hypothetical protein
VTSCYSGNLLVLVGYTAIPTFCSNHEQTPNIVEIAAEIDSYDWLHILKVSVARKSGLHQKGYGFLMQTAKATVVNLPHACEFSFL